MKQCKNEGRDLWRSRPDSALDGGLLCTSDGLRVEKLKKQKLLDLCEHPYTSYVPIEDQIEDRCVPLMAFGLKN